VVEALGLGGYFGEEGKGRFKVTEPEAAAEAIVDVIPHDLFYI
jgi:hypothetical protein